MCEVNDQFISHIMNVAASRFPESFAEDYYEYLSPRLAGKLQNEGINLFHDEIPFSPDVKLKITNFVKRTRSDFVVYYPDSDHYAEHN